MVVDRKEELVFALDEPNNDQNEIKLDKNARIINIILVFFSFIFILFSYVVIKPLNNNYSNVNGEISKGYCFTLLFILLIVFIIFYKLKKLTYINKIYFILILGLLVKLMYMLYTPMNVRQYDTFSDNHNGHYDYTLYLFEHNNKLPNHPFTESDIYQFYHPPLNYFIQANFMKMMNFFLTSFKLNYSNENLFGTCQILSCFYMFLTSIYFIKTIHLTKFNNKTKLFIIFFSTLYPRLNQFSGQLNNDPLAALFVVLSMYQIFKWYLKKKSFLNILLSSLYLGLAMSCKLSAVTVIFGYAVVFLIEFINSLKHKEDCLKFSKLLVQYFLFLLIIIPLGFWFQLYSHNVYKIPFNFVFRSLNSELFTGYRGYIVKQPDVYSLSYYDKHNSGLIYTNHLYNIFVRYISPIYIKDYSVSPVFCNAFENYNILSYAIRSSIMGEFSYYYGENFAIISTILGYIIYFIIFITIVYLLVRRKFILDKEFILSFSIFISMILFFLYLQISMPFGCSMDFRYIVPIILPMSIILGKLHDNCTLSKSKVANSFSILIKYSTILFTISSTIFYLLAI